MRHLRAALVVTVAALAVPSAASAQIDSLSVSGGRLANGGASVVVTLTYQCQVGWNVAFGDVTVAQVSGKKLARGDGFFSNNFPGVPCTGGPETRDVTVDSFTSFAFKQGRATATSVNLSVFNPTTFGFVTQTAGPTEFRLRKH
jgi:hypothetical protein